MIAVVKLSLRAVTELRAKSKTYKSGRSFFLHAAGLSQFAKTAPSPRKWEQPMFLSAVLLISQAPALTIYVSGPPSAPSCLRPGPQNQCIPRAQHVNPLHEGVMPVDMDTADVHGDIFFDLRSKVLPIAGPACVLSG